MRGLAFLWLAFAILFFGLGCFHFVESRRTISPFEVTKLKKTEMEVEFGTPLTGVDIEKPLRDFAQDFNAYLEDYNKSSRRQNLFATFGYFLAAATALVSMWLTLRV